MIIQIKNDNGDVIATNNADSLKDLLSTVQGIDLTGADLKGQDLTNIVIPRSNMSTADLKGTDFKGSNLEESNLSGADLRGAKFDGADLYRAGVANAKIYESQKDSFLKALRIEVSPDPITPPPVNP